MSSQGTSGANNQGFPQLGTQMVDAGGRVGFAWYRLFISLWRRNGGGFLSNINAAYLQQKPTNAGAPVTVHKASDGSLIGTIPVVNIPGGPAEPLTPGASPWVYAAVKDGTLVAFGTQIDLSRDSGANWFQVSLVGGALPMLAQDQARLTWFGTVPPATFFPIAS